MLLFVFLCHQLTICPNDVFESHDLEHMTNMHKEIIRVTRVAGRISSSEGGGWPEHPHLVLMQLYNPQSKQYFKVRADARGDYHLDVPEGTYCFKVSAPGWQNFVGTIVVDGKAPKANRLNLTLPLGV